MRRNFTSAGIHFSAPQLSSLYFPCLFPSWLIFSVWNLSLPCHFKLLVGRNCLLHLRIPHIPGPVVDKTDVLENELKFQKLYAFMCPFVLFMVLLFGLPACRILALSGIKPALPEFRKVKSQQLGPSSPCPSLLFFAPSLRMMRTIYSVIFENGNLTWRVNGSLPSLQSIPREEDDWFTVRLTRPT